MIKFLNAVLCIGVAVALIPVDGRAAKGGSKGSGGGGTCTLDIPITWDIRTAYPDGTVTAITGDNAVVDDDHAGTLYVDGGNGVERSVINLCSTTGDATLLLARSGNGTAARSISVSFASSLHTNNDTPTWAQSSLPVSGTWFLNVRKIWYLPPGKGWGDEFPFTTHLSSTTPNSGHVRMLNPAAVAVPPVSGSGANSPDTNSLVNVYHCPEAATAPTSGACTGVTMETWYVWPTLISTTTTPPSSAYVASLVLDGKHNTQINGGEFSIPFFFVITRQPTQ